MDEVSRAGELFLTGTTTDVTPIVAMDGRRVGGGTPGPVARMLLDRLLERMTSSSRPSAAVTS